MRSTRPTRKRRSGRSWSKIADIVGRHDSGTVRDVGMCWDLTRPDIVEDVERRVEAYINTFGVRWGKAPAIQQVEAA